MKVFVAGAGGAVGRPLVAQLVAAGHQVTATTRGTDKHAALRALGADPVVLDGLDGGSVGEAVARAEPDAIIHQMTALAGPPDLRRFDRWFATTNKLRTAGTDHLLAAARASGVGRFIVQSYTGWPNERTGGPVKTEADPLDPDPAPAQRESMRAIQHLERAVLAAPLVGTVLRYGSFYGPGSESLPELVRGRKFPLVGRGTGVFSWLHVDDAASAAVAALGQERSDLYQIADDEPAPLTEWLPYLARLLGAKPPLRLPVWLARLAGGEVVVRMTTQMRGASNEKAKQGMGWQPARASWRDGFRQWLT